MKFVYYKTNHGIIFKQAEYSYTTNLGNISSINGIDVNDIPRIYPSWYKIDSEIKDVHVKVPGRRIPDGWVLRDPTLPMPAELTDQDLWLTEDDDDVPVFDGPKKSIGPLYDRRYKYEPETSKPVDFTATLISEVEIDSLNQPDKMVIKYKGSTRDNAVDTDLSKIVVYEELERILTPEFLLHRRPCMLTSEQVYSIVRAYIKDHIDPACARITSDYNFCFEVKKIVRTTPYFSTESYIRGRQWKTKEVRKEEKLVDLFSMTYRGYSGNGGYGKYPCINEWRANSLVEMQQHIKEYLSDLMEEINRPVEECSHCNGNGHIVRPIDTNSRK